MSLLFDKLGYWAIAEKEASYWIAIDLSESKNSSADKYITNSIYYNIHVHYFYATFQLFSVKLGLIT